MEDLKNTLVPVGNSNTIVNLSDITNIRKAYLEPATSKVKVNGMEAISLSISLKEGANIIQMGKEVDKVLKKWNEKLPVGLTVARLASMDHYVKKVLMILLAT